MELDLTVELGMLLDTYGKLLTPKMRDMLTMYVFENMSYQEIGDYYNISKPAVLDAIKTSQKKLNDIENKVGFLKLKKELQKLTLCNNDIKQELINILKEL